MFSMCVAAVGMVQSIQGQRAIINFKGALQEVSIALLPRVKTGEYVVVHAGFASEIVKDVPKLYQEVVATDARARQLLDAIERETEKIPKEKIRIMNFCGSHETTIVQYGIRELLPEKIELVSGPGCPVCVTAVEEIAMGMEAVRKHNVTLTTFGDLLRVPTPWGSLEQLQEAGADIRVIYDAQQALQLAKESTREVVHFAVGFETTAPVTAAIVKEASSLSNFSILSSHRITLPAIQYVLDHYKLDAVLCPGHVAMVIGRMPFANIFNPNKIPYVIGGFEPIDVLEGILLLLQQIRMPSVKNNNQYARVVQDNGNVLAQQLIDDVFQLTDSYWRGLEIVPDSRLILRDEYRKFDAEYRFNLTIPARSQNRNDDACSCGSVLSGSNPRLCSSFANECTPEHPLGPCMVSQEGSCRIHYTSGL
jgi:hydrogenase expression/formation protein HypD